MKTMKLRFTVEAELEKLGGPHLPVPAVARELLRCLDEDANPQIIWPAGQDGDETEYVVKNWEVKET